jgi:hypothetical protein
MHLKLGPGARARWLLRVALTALAIVSVAAPVDALTPAQRVILLSGKKHVTPPAPSLTGGLLLVDGTDPVFLVNGTSGVCLTGGGC